MAVRIVEEVPGGLGLRRLVRGVAVVLGMALVVAGLLAAVLPMLLVFVTVSAIIAGDELTGLSGRDLRDLALFVGGAALSLWLGLRLIRGRRRLGLYLRKFGFADTTRTVSHALASALGRSLRLVTLDDSMVAAMGAGRGRRRLAGLAWLTAAAAVVWLLSYAYGGAFDRDSQQILDDAMDQAGDDLGAAIGAVFAAALVATLLLIAVLVLVNLAIGVALLGGGSYLAARRVERSASRTLTSEAAVDSTVHRLAAAGRRIFAARLNVIAVPTSFWQRAVHALAAVSDVAIIDVSKATDNLIWEIQNVKPILGERWVLVGARDQVAMLARPETLAAGTPHGLLARLLDGEEIIAYGPARPDQRRFARALRRRLEQMPRRTSATRLAP
jgi:uncharacterized membrane protein YkgB